MSRFSVGVKRATGALALGWLMAVSFDAAAASWWSGWWSSWTSSSSSRLNISGTPPSSVTVDQWYSFRPTTTGSSRRLTYSISNKPRWASFSTTTGQLSGRPRSWHVGTYSNIVIRVSDGRSSDSLRSFSITVRARTQEPDPQPQPDPEPPTNRAPTISGTAPSQVVAGTAYSFRPTASDPDGDRLSFSINNRPGWASFDTSTGRLSGTPSASDVNTYNNIVISVSDGRGGTASLPAFSITVTQTTNGRATVSWSPPTRNTDGTALNNLAGYRIYYGTRSGGPYSNSVTISNPSTTSHVVENLTPGTYYFVVTARNSAGVESEYSNQASKTVN